MAKEKKGFGFFLWFLIFALIALAADQFLVRVPLAAPGLHEFQVFYQDFRQRLLLLPQTQTVKKPAPAATTPAAVKPSPPAAIPAPTTFAPAPTPVPARPPDAPVPAVPAAKTKAEMPVQYVYADAQGNLQFADSLDEIPAKLRKEAKRLDH